METNEKSRILVQLSRTEGEKARAALEKQASLRSEILLIDSDFVRLSEAISDLQIFAFRVPELTVQICREFLRRLDTEKVEFSFDGEAIEKFDRSDSFSDGLAKDAIELLGQVRYFAMDEVVDVLVPLTLSKRSTVARASKDILRDCAKFDLSVYYGGEDYRGLGAAPQDQILRTFEKYKTEFLLTHIGAVLAVAAELLSPNMEGGDWDYDSVTLKFAPVPVGDDIGDIRRRTLLLLIAIYNAADETETRSDVLATMYAVASRPMHGELTPELTNLIERDVLKLLDFVQSVLPRAVMPIVQKIEHDTYWLHYHSPSEAVKVAALQVRDLIDKNDEYSIYKNLIGFEGIFEAWEGAGKGGSEYQRTSELRAAIASEYAQSISKENWSEWRERIIEFAKTQSNDLATFSNFYDFLQELASLQPELMFGLVSEHPESIRGFTIPIYRGLWRGPMMEETKEFLLKEVSKGEQLSAAARLFLSVKTIDRDLLNSVLRQAIEGKDIWILTELIGVACSRFKDDAEYTVERIFRPALNQLIEVGSTHWIENVWFNRDAGELVANLGEDDRKLVLRSMLELNDVSYRAEEILKPIAAVDPLSVIDFFGERISRDKPRASYHAVPFRFQKLGETLSQYPDLLVETVRSWYNGGGLFEYTGGKFLAEIFPSFPADFERCLMSLVTDGSDEDIKFVLLVLRNYEGETFLHDLCKAIIVQRPGVAEFESLVRLVLISTGVLSGEYGHAEAYERKAEEIKAWLDDSNENVSRFASKYIEMTQMDAKSERERADEEIALRKHRFGHEVD